ncbi:hypothetical protein ES705_15892 [subsurface metagenome]
MGGDERNTGGKIYIDDVSWIHGDPEQTSIKDNFDVKGVYVYPNPVSSGIVNITNLTIGSEVTVWNVIGQRVKSFIATSESMQVDINELSKGIYFVETGSNTNRAVSKLIVK